MSERHIDVTYYDFNSTLSFYSPILIHQTYLKLSQRLHYFFQQWLRGTICSVNSTAAATQRCAYLGRVIGILRELIVKFRFLVQKLSMGKAVSCTWDTCAAQVQCTLVMKFSMRASTYAEDSYVHLQ